MRIVELGEILHENQLGIYWKISKLVAIAKQKISEEILLSQVFFKVLETIIVVILRKKNCYKNKKNIEHIF